MRALALIALAAAGAFCAAQVPPASNVPSATMKIPPLSENAPATTMAPPSPPSGPALDVPAPATAPPLAGSGREIALVLPLDASDYARAAEAVRAGFMDAAELAGAQDRVDVIGHGDADVLDAFAKARDAGARVIVGPLVRDHLKALAASGLALPPTIALNQLDDGTAMPPLVYTLALAIESDARVVAHRVHDDGAAHVAIITSNAPLMKRFASAFAGEWLLSGGSAPATFAFVATPDGLSALRRDLAREPVDAVVIAVEGADAALVKTFAPRVVTYASAQVNQRASPGTMRDLDDVRVVDLPWLITPDAPAFAKLPHRSFANIALDRLYALGIDAFQVADAFTAGVPVRFELDGATGHLALAEGRQVTREGMLGVFRQGKLVPMGEASP